jgi:hypothetical protein
MYVIPGHDPYCLTDKNAYGDDDDYQARNGYDVQHRPLI